jgi:hypothetical protein
VDGETRLRKRLECDRFSSHHSFSRRTCRRAVAVNLARRGSTRAKLSENVLGVDESIGGDIGIGVADGLVKRGTVSGVEPIAGVEG